jgi:hypothetical protein
MNIFVLDNCPEFAAKYQCDKHVVKMVLETAQLLCSAHETAPYKRTHYNHPCAIWTRSSMGNYDWLVRHGLALAREYTFRYNKIHKSTEVIEWAMLNKPNILDLGLLPFAQAMPDQYKNPDDAVSAYRNYYMNEKARIATWTKTETPYWYVVEVLNNVH